MNEGCTLQVRPRKRSVFWGKVSGRGVPFLTDFEKGHTYPKDSQNQAHLRNNFRKLLSRHSDGERAFPFARRGICFIGSDEGDRDKQIPRFAPKEQTSTE
jgi:hypothetical protein